MFSRFLQEKLESPDPCRSLRTRSITWPASWLACPSVTGRPGPGLAAGVCWCRQCLCTVAARQQGRHLLHDAGSENSVRLRGSAVLFLSVLRLPCPPEAACGREPGARAPCGATLRRTAPHASTPGASLWTHPVRQLLVAHWKAATKIICEGAGCKTKSGGPSVAGQTGAPVFSRARGGLTQGVFCLEHRGIPGLFCGHRAMRQGQSACRALSCSDLRSCDLVAPLCTRQSGRTKAPGGAVCQPCLPVVRGIV